jgi:hypothetical protein
MNTDLVAVIVANQDRAMLAAVGIGIGAAAYLIGRRIVGAVTKLAFLIVAVAAAQMLVVKDWDSDELLNRARGFAGKVMTQQIMCDFGIIPSEAKTLLCSRPSPDRSATEAHRS